MLPQLDAWVELYFILNTQLYRESGISQDIMRKADLSPYEMELMAMLDRTAQRLAKEHREERRSSGNFNNREKAKTYPQRF